jgi:hypothetical protein
VDNPLEAVSGYNPVHVQDPILDPKTNLDEYAVAAGRDAADSAANAILFPFGSVSRLYFMDRVRLMRARQVALLAAYYIEHELTAEGGKPDVVVRVVEMLEAETCLDGCRELRDALKG